MTELEQANAAGYAEALFEDFDSVLTWAQNEVPSGDADLAAQALADCPFRTIDGQVPQEVLQLATLFDEMAFRGLNINDITTDDVLYNKDFHEQVRPTAYPPERPEYYVE